MNGFLVIPYAIEQSNFTGAKACSAFCIIDSVLSLEKYRFNADGLKRFSTTTVPDRSCFTLRSPKRNTTRTPGSPAAQSRSSSFSESCRHSQN